MSEEKPADDKPVLTLEQKDAFRKKLFGIQRHINRVRENGEKLVERLVETSETEDDLDFARRLLHRIQAHDMSKFMGIEFDALDSDSGSDLFKLAIKQHHQTNDHHPAFFGEGGIKQMNDLQIAEFVLDCGARAQEMGTDLRTYMKETAPKRFGFTTKTKVYQNIKKSMDLLLDPTFG